MVSFIAEDGSEFVGRRPNPNLTVWGLSEAFADLKWPEQGLC